MAVSLLNAGFPSSVFLCQCVFFAKNQPFEISSLGDSFKGNFVPSTDPPKQGYSKNPHGLQKTVIGSSIDAK